MMDCLQLCPGNCLVASQGSSRPEHCFFVCVWGFGTTQAPQNFRGCFRAAGFRLRTCSQENNQNIWRNGNLERVDMLHRLWLRHHLRLEVNRHILGSLRDLHRKQGRET